jgi:hypothetical protein
MLVTRPVERGTIKRLGREKRFLSIIERSSEAQPIPWEAT